MCRILGQPVPALQESCLSFLFLEDGEKFEVKIIDISEELGKKNKSVKKNK